MKLRALLCAALLLGVIALTAGARDQERPKPEGEAPKITNEYKAAENVAAAFRLAKFGRDNKSPAALLAAAHVIGKTDFTKFDLKETKIEGLEEFDSLKEVTRLIDDAVKVSNNSDAVKAMAKMIQDEVKERNRGAIGGPRTINGSVSAGDRRDTFPIQFRGGEPAIVIVNNLSNRGDIDLYVQDDNGRIIARDRRSDDDASVSFYPQQNARYYVIVHCYKAGATLRYRLTTN